MKFLFSITVWPCFGKKLYVWLSACGVLIVGCYFKYVFLLLGDLERKVLCNCIHSLSLPSFLFPSCLYNLTNSKLLNPLNAKLNWITYFRFCYQSKLTNVSNIYTTVQFFFYIADAYLEGICNANTTSGCLDENAECKDSVCHCSKEYSNINGTCKAGKLDNHCHRHRIRLR